VAFINNFRPCFLQSIGLDKLDARGNTQIILHVLDNSFSIFCSSLTPPESLQLIADFYLQVERIQRAHFVNDDLIIGLQSFNID